MIHCFARRSDFLEPENLVDKRLGDSAGKRIGIFGDEPRFSDLGDYGQGLCDLVQVLLSLSQPRRFHSLLLGNVRGFVQLDCPGDKTPARFEIRYVMAQDLDDVKTELSADQTGNVSRFKGESHVLEFFDHAATAKGSQAAPLGC